MFTSTLELITLAASNSHILFCFCNLIIAILLIGTKPVFSNFHRQVTVPPPVTGNEGSHNVVDYNEKGTINGAPVTLLVMVDDTELDHEAANVDRDDKQNVTPRDKEEEEEEEVEEGEDDRDDDELRRRVEEFIDKINKAWKAEKLGHIPIYST